MVLLVASLLCSDWSFQWWQPYPCLVPDLTGLAFRFSPLSVMLAVGLSYTAFTMLMYFMCTLRGFVINRCWILSNAFSASIEMLMQFYPSPCTLLMWCFVLMICECRTIPASYNKSYLILLCVCSQSCPTLCSPMDCSPLGSSIRGILQARILGWAAISSRREPSQPRDWTRVSCTLRQILYH